MAMVVDEKDQAAVRFYRHFDLLPLQRTPMTLYLAMTMVAGPQSANLGALSMMKPAALLRPVERVLPGSRSIMIG
jgi:hypothetical protein